jgi:hypothetical protein
MLGLLAADLLIWRSWAVAASQPVPVRDAAPGALPWAGAATRDYLGVCALAAIVATVVLGLCVLARLRQLRHSSHGPPAPLIRWAAAGIIVLGASAVAALALGR